MGTGLKVEPEDCPESPKPNLEGQRDLVSRLTSWDNYVVLPYEPLSKLLVSPLTTPIVLPYIIPYITPFKEFRL